MNRDEQVAKLTAEMMEITARQVESFEPRWVANCQLLSGVAGLLALYVPEEEIRSMVSDAFAMVKAARLSLGLPLRPSGKGGLH
jgi:hypothetical protein